MANDKYGIYCFFNASKLQSAAGFIPKTILELEEFENSHGALSTDFLTDDPESVVELVSNEADCNFGYFGPFCKIVAHRDDYSDLDSASFDGASYTISDFLDYNDPAIEAVKSTVSKTAIMYGAANPPVSLFAAW